MGQFSTANAKQKQHHGDAVRAELPPWDTSDESVVTRAKPRHSCTMDSFRGDIASFKDVLLPLDLDGEWEEKPNGVWRFRCRNKAGLNWASTTGRIWFDGPEPFKTDIKKQIDELASGGKAAIKRAAPMPSRRVFVVYGHDTAARTQLEAMLRRWDLEPVILDQMPSKGQTIIEKLDECRQDVGFAVVLATPDDEGHKRENPDQILLRARQNVVLELGMMLAAMGRSKVAILMHTNPRMERPSDIQGLLYIPFKDNVDEGKVLLAKEMHAQGIAIDLSKL
jgi:predicted nucleotide-binding protein